MWGVEVGEGLGCKWCEVWVQEAVKWSVGCCDAKVGDGKNELAVVEMECGLL